MCLLKERCLLPPAVMWEKTTDYCSQCIRRQLQISFSRLGWTCAKYSIFIDPSGQPTFDGVTFQPILFFRRQWKNKTHQYQRSFSPIYSQNGRMVNLKDSIEALRNGKYLASIVDANGCVISKDFTLYADTLRARSKSRILHPVKD